MIWLLLLASLVAVDLGTAEPRQEIPVRGSKNRALTTSQSNLKARQGMGVQIYWDCHYTEMGDYSLTPGKHKTTLHRKCFLCVIAIPGNRLGQ